MIKYNWNIYFKYQLHNINNIDNLRIERLVYI